MFAIKDITYADAGNLIRGARTLGFQSLSSWGEFTEEAVNLDDMRLVDGVVVCNGGMFHWTFPQTDYGSVKKHVIGLRYSNDDQIAIILNREESEDGALAYDKMQEWRDWASVVAKKVVALFNQKDEE